MKSINKFIAGIAAEFTADLNAALERVSIRLLGRVLDESDRCHCHKYTFTMPNLCPCAAAFTYKGQLILLTGGVDCELAVLGKASWWIKEMI